MNELNKFRLSLFLTFIILIISSFPFILKSHNRLGLISEWFQLDSLPFTQEFHVTLGWQKYDTNYIIIVGGRVNGTTSNKVLIFNTVSNQYRYLKPLPIPIERAGGFVIEDSIYIAGGSLDTGNYFHNYVYKLDLTSTAPWVLRSNFPVIIGEITYSTAALNDEFAYVVGGRSGIGALNTVFIYNATVDSWYSASSLPCSGRYGGGLAVVNDSTLLFIGGRDSSMVYSQTYMGNVDSSNPTMINWSPGPQYPTGPIYYLGSWGTKSGYGYFTGGNNSILKFDINIDATSKTFRYNSSTGTFDTLSDKPTPVSHTQIFGFDSIPSPPPTIHKIYAPGGNSSGSAQRVHELLVVTDTSMSGIKYITGQKPTKYALYQNYPNPFNSNTVIRFTISRKGKAGVRFTILKVYDLFGREIALLVNQKLPAGCYEVEWNASKFPSGVYFYQLEVGGGKEYLMTKRMVYIK